MGRNGRLGLCRASCTASSLPSRHSNHKMQHRERDMRRSSTKIRSAVRRLPLTLLLLGLGLWAQLFFSPASALAGTASGWAPLFSFKATETPEGELSQPRGIAVDQSRGSVYVVDNPEVSSGKRELTLDKFNLDGEPAPFSSSGKSWLTLKIEPTIFSTAVAVDNYGPNKGQIYILGLAAPSELNSQTLEAYSPTGELLWKIDTGLEYACGLTIDIEGHPWIGRHHNFNETALEFAANGSPPAKIGSLGGFASEISPCELGFAADGSTFANVFGGHNLNNPLEKYENEEWRPFGPLSVAAFTIDQSSPAGHIFSLEGLSDSIAISEYSPTGERLAVGGEGFLNGAQKIAYDSLFNRVYVPVNSNSPRVIAFEYASGTVPDVTISAATSTGPTTAHFTGTVDPDGVNNSWHFEWKRLDQSWTEAESSPTEILPADDGEHEVSLDATGLAEHEIYVVRLVAVNTDLGLKATSAERTFSDVTPVVTTMPAAPRTDTSARLNARIYAGGNPSTYTFEYSSDGVIWTTLPQRSAPEGPGGVVVGEEVGGLEPNITYRYRVNVESALGPASPQGVELTFATRTSEEMAPPQRKNELVNSPDKGNQNVGLPGSGMVPMSPDGERALWFVSGGAPGGNNGSSNAFLAERTTSGWRSRALAPPAAQQIGEGAYGYSISNANRDLTEFVGLAGPAGGGGSLIRLDDSQKQDLLTTFEKSSSGFAGNASVEMTTDGAHVVELNPDTNLLEDVGSGSSEVVGLMPNGAPPTCGMSTEGESFVGPGSAGLGASRNWRPGYKRISATDASRVYFEAKANGKCAGSYGLYERNRESEETKLIDGKEPHLIRVTPDGREAYFTTASKLDPADTNNSNDVYRWEEEAGGSTCLTCVSASAKVSDVTATLVSDDFSHVYFESTVQLTPDAPADATNLYSLSEGKIRFVASTAVDLRTRSNLALSADGKTLLLRLVANRALSSDDVESECPFPGEGGGITACQELYRYDDRDGSLECVSCLAGGKTTRSIGSSSSDPNTDFKISADGETIAFATSETMLPADVNHDTDIYEWRQGAIRLITDGVSEFGEFQAAPQVYAIEANGRDILFSLVAKDLTGFERDGLANVYDARIGGGFEVPSPPAHCSEESCQGPLQGAPASERPGSSSLAGAGNAGKSPKRGRCTAKQGKAKRRCRLGRHKHDHPDRKHHQHAEHRRSK